MNPQKAIKLGVSVFVSIIALIFISASNTKVTPGYVGIKVSTTGSQKDAKDYPIQRGRVWYNPLTTDVYKFPTFTQNRTWTKSHDEGKALDESVTFNSIEGASVNADVALAYSFQAEKVPLIFVEFRQDAESITEGYMRNKVRAAFGAIGSKEKISDIYGAGKQEFVTRVKDYLNADLGPKGFTFDMVDFVGRPRLPENVLEAINQSLEATQNAQTAENQLRITQAEAAKAIAKAEGEAKSQVISAEGDARANQIRQASLSQGILRSQALDKWDGHFPQVMGSSNNLLQLVLGGSGTEK
jgi:regulator of protease activity HflC (stomatin/prohibitin superfamily)